MQHHSFFRNLPLYSFSIIIVMCQKVWSIRSERVSYYKVDIHTKRQEQASHFTKLQ